jgi:hypothetical protein
LITSNNFHSLLFATISLWIQSNHGVEIDGEIGQLVHWKIEEISIETTKDSKMSHNHERLSLTLSLSRGRWRERERVGMSQGVSDMINLKDHRFKSSDDIDIAFPSRIAIAELIPLSGFILLRIFGFDLLIGQTITHTTLNITKSSPLNITRTFNLCCCQRSELC